LQGGGTLRELYLNGKQMLREAGTEDPAFDALCLMQQVFHVDRAGLAIHGSEAAAAGKTERYCDLLAKRAEGMPLQYLLGEWDFLSLRLSVREGVLIPRPETELLCETAAEYLQETAGRQVLDLCAGTGAVGLGICSMVPGAEVQCVERYDTPFACLTENLQRYPQWHVEPVCADVLSDPELNQFHKVDVIVSNPPYIAAAEIPTLQREVLREPVEALDGGPDGLLFYRAITSRWVGLLRNGGLVAVEIGEEQGKAVAALFGQAGLCGVAVRKDMAGHDRIVLGRKP